MRLWFHCDEERCSDEDSPRGSGFGLWLLLLRAFTWEGIGAAGRGAEGGTHSVPGHLCQHKAPSTACPCESCSSPGLGLRKAPVLGNNASQGCGQWGMLLWWPGLVSCRPGAAGAVPEGRLQQCHPTDHTGLCSPLREGSSLPLHRSIIMSLLSICGAKSWPSGAWSDQTSNNFPSHTRWENF